MPPMLVFTSVCFCPLIYSMPDLILDKSSMECASTIKHALINQLFVQIKGNVSDKIFLPVM